jgi:hypothetical protein
MNPDDSREPLSHRFDEHGVESTPADQWQREDWDAWSMIERHIATREVVALPADFAQRVRRAAIRAQRRKDAVLILQTAIVTGAVLTLVVASALGADWWQRLLATLQPGRIAEVLPRVAADFQTAIPAFSSLATLAERGWRFLPIALFTTAILAIAIELAVFRFLRVGPFHRKPTF